MPSFLAYQSGQYKPLEEVCIALNDAGFVYGATVTDQCRTYRQKPFKLSEHIVRFRKGCEVCEISLSHSDDEIATIVQRLIVDNSKLVPPNTEWSVIWFATPGTLGYFLGQRGGMHEAHVQLVVYCFPLPTFRFRNYFKSGAEVWTFEANSRNQPKDFFSLLLEQTTRIKHRSRISWWIADNAIRKQHPGAQALCADYDSKLITETSSANFLLAKNGTIFSPSPYDILPGISLKTTHELCQKMNIAFEFKNLWFDDLATSDEALLCSTPYGIAPIGNLNGRQLPVNGPVFERLLAAWNDLVGLDIREQFLSAST